MIHHSTHQIRTRGKGTYEITEEIHQAVKAAGIKEGVATVFVRHTSCSLTIMENADPSARKDLDTFFETLVPESYPHFIHTDEGPDDMPSHIRSVLTRTSESIPVSRARLLLGTWQGVFLFEHRRAPHTREVVITVMGE
jgi:secondary thiamine-phosphate synthase enzyme